MEITDILTIVVAILIFAIIILLFIYWNMSRKEKTEKTNEKGGNEGEENLSSNTYYSKLSVFDFMKFDTIEDNMIVQNNGERYAMVIECEGINYDLMSEVEKTSVEQGFIEFLNTLRHPIQLYIQTRTINISNSIEKYNQKLDQTKQELLAKRSEYNKMLQSNNVDSKILNNLKMEIARLQNLFDYGTDIISNTEKMSLNKNVLRKHYYIVLSYYTAELGTNITDEEEKKNMIFSELYTRAQTIIRTLFACSMKGKVLDSNELVELLYVAYNRDEAEVYGVDKAIRAGYTELYSTAPDVLDKKMKAIDKEIEEKALEKAKSVVDKVKSEKEKIVEKKEETMEELIDDFAKLIINDNKRYIGKDIADEAISEIDNTKEEVSNNVKKETKTRRTRTKKSN
jgi:hypothetical protein